ncbi:hypothetical protein [Serratia marcescens]|uniref:hypothetical protein n=1 Tax=Serratia marcescens TaxID=615 RepID=UPI00074518C9|nr:hypothetical protein [Serratia marcescens]CVD66788.1 Uncharacterised protein [Serratia marcescens]CVG12050.1 Uncharacterised protein [Serratia marcescens]
MTAIAIWFNQEESRGIWAVSDSRVSQGNSVMTDNVPKIFSIPVKVTRCEDMLHRSPVHIFDFGFCFAGSTIIGTNVKEMLSISISNLTEVNFSSGGAPVNNEAQTFKSFYPSLVDIAKLTKFFGEKYIRSLGELFPENVRTSMSVFGYCFKMRKFIVVKMSNSPESPAALDMSIHEFNGDEYILLGDSQSELSNAIEHTRSQFVENSLNWWRAPFIALNNWVNQQVSSTIGGYTQLCISNEFRTKVEHLSNINDQGLQTSYAGINYTDEFSSSIGGFILMPMSSMTLPGVDGWPQGNLVRRHP